MAQLAIRALEYDKNTTVLVYYQLDPNGVELCTNNSALIRRQLLVNLKILEPN